jgi:hypothetical protein
MQMAGQEWERRTGARGEPALPVRRRRVEECDSLPLVRWIYHLDRAAGGIGIPPPFAIVVTPDEDGRDSAGCKEHGDKRLCSFLGKCRRFVEQVTEDPYLRCTSFRYGARQPFERGPVRASRDRLPVVLKGLGLAEV